MPTDSPGLNFKDPHFSGRARRQRTYGHILLGRVWQSATLTDVQAELANGADIQARDWEGATPLHEAASNGNPEVVIALVEAGANIKAPDWRRPE